MFLILILMYKLQMFMLSLFVPYFVHSLLLFMLSVFPMLTRHCPLKAPSFSSDDRH